MTTIPLKHDAASLLTQLTIATYNLKHIPLQEIIEVEDGLEAYANIGLELAQIGQAIVSYMNENKK